MSRHRKIEKRNKQTGEFKNLRTGKKENNRR